MQRIKSLQVTYVQLYLITLMLAIGAVWTEQLHAVLPFLQSITPVFSDLTMLGFALPVLLAARKSFGLQTVVITIGIAGFLLEHLSSQFGIPYGYFSYLDGFALKIGGTPAVIALAWITVVMGSVAMAQGNGIKKLLLAALIAVMLDLTLDPAAVGLGFWEWQETGLYYGIPISNFLGWFIAGLALGSVGMLGYTSKNKDLTKAAILSLFLVASFWTNVAILQGLWIPAGIGITFVWLINEAKKVAAP